MVDGYVWVIGKFGVCFIIIGLGMINIFIVMVQVYVDLILMLVIFSVNECVCLVYGNGYLYELLNQCNLVGNVCVFSYILMSVEELLVVFVCVFVVFDSEWLWLVYIELLFDVIIVFVEYLVLCLCIVISCLVLVFVFLCEVVVCLCNVKKLLLLFGGGCVEVVVEVCVLVVVLDVLIVLMINVKGLLLVDYLLLLGSNQFCVLVCELVVEVDVVLVIGIELGEIDYDVVFDGGFVFDGELICIDIDLQ